jgi:hypothetical protein
MTTNYSIDRRLLPVSYLKIKLRGRRFGSNENVMKAVNEFFEGIQSFYSLKAKGM